MAKIKWSIRGVVADMAEELERLTECSHAEALDALANVLSRSWMREEIYRLASDVIAERRGKGEIR